MLFTTHSQFFNCRFSVSLKVDDGKEALPVFINVSILAFPMIDTVNLKVTIDYYLNLRWYDSRLEYRDLNGISSLNSLSLENMNGMWTPKIAFVNALGPIQTKVDTLSDGVLVKEDEPLGEDISLFREGE